MKRLALLAAPAILLLAACGGGGDDDGTFFELADANDAAHAAMLDTASMPGSGWEVTSRDEPDDDNFDFEAAAKTEPACSTFNDLSALSEAGGIFGDSEEQQPAGWADIELSRAGSGQTLPTTAEMEVEIEATVGDVQDGWKIAKKFLESDGFSECMAQVVLTMFEQDESLSDFNIKMEPKPSSAEAPHDGATIAFLMTIAVPTVITIEASIEMYMWPYGNAGVSVIFIGDKNQLTKTLIEEILKAADEKVIAAEKDF